MSEDIENARLLYEQALRFENWVHMFDQKVNSKLSDIVGLDSAVLVVLFGLAYFLLKDDMEKINRVIVAIPLALSLILFVLSMGVAVYHYRPQVFEIGMVVAGKGKATKSYASSLVDLSTNINESADKNMETVNKRADGLRNSMYCILAGFGFLIFAAFALLYHWLS
jgi:hypothetical protein